MSKVHLNEVEMKSYLSSTSEAGKKVVVKCRRTISGKSANGAQVAGII